MRVRLHTRPAGPFATVAVSMFWATPLNEADLTPYALIPFIIRRGSQAHPETADLRQQYEWRYGLRSSFDLIKRGNAHILQAQLNAVAPSFTSDPDYSFTEAFSFWWKHLMEPATEPGRTDGFREDYTSQEKENIRRRIASQKNDPISYAYDQTVRIALRNQQHRLSVWGEAASLEQWDGTSLWQAYERWKEHAELDIYIYGEADIEACCKILSSDAEVIHQPQDGWQERLRGMARMIPEPDEAASEPVRFAWEPSEGDQVKLNMAYRLPVYRADERYPVAVMMNGVLGGFAHSKLFQNVREKASLAYYASSRYDPMTGMVFIQTGVGPSREPEARRVIQQQIEAMQQGDISEDEWQQTLALLTHAFREREDDPFAWPDATHANAWSGAAWTMENLIEAIHQVTIEDVRLLTAQLQLDTIYRYGPEASPEPSGQKEDVQ